LCRTTCFDFSNKNKLFENPEIFEKLKTYNYANLALSVLFFYLQTNYKKKEMSLSVNFGY